ncbi:MAG: addiction module protein [Armatimonadota bacterium]|nr:addiction module protein [Armatimonadota bacterium]
MATLTFEEIRSLSVAERIQLVEDIWDSIAATPEALELPEAQRQELDGRLQAYQQDPNAGTSWDDVKAKLNS